MLKIAKLLCCLIFMSVSVFSQDTIQKVMVGPTEENFRVLIAFIEPLQDAYKMQSLIIDFDNPKFKNELPNTFKIDVTSTVRLLTTGEKKQKILILIVKDSNEIQFKCDGKFVKKDSTQNTNTLIENVKLILKSLPLDSKKPTEAKLTKEIEDKVKAIFKSVNTEEFPCLRSLN